MKKPKPKTKPDLPNLFTFQKESGLNVAHFCAVHNISTSSFVLVISNRTLSLENFHS
jgi:hypothetical protein